MSEAEFRPTSTGGRGQVVVRVALAVVLVVGVLGLRGARAGAPLLAGMVAGAIAVLILGVGQWRRSLRSPDRLVVTPEALETWRGATRLTRVSRIDPQYSSGLFSRSLSLGLPALWAQDAHALILLQSPRWDPATLIAAAQAATRDWPQTPVANVEGIPPHVRVGLAFRHPLAVAFGVVTLLALTAIAVLLIPVVA